MALIPSNSKSSDDKKAEQKAAEDDALLREVDDAVRQDQYSDFGKKYGRPLLAALVLGLAGFGGYLWWDSEREAAMEADSEQLVSAMDQIDAGNLQTGREALDKLIASDNAGARTVALMLQGGVLLEQDDAEGAARVFGQVANDAEAPQAYRDLAVVRQVAVQFDTMEPGEIITRLKPIAVPENAYFGSAGEMLAMAYLDQGKRKEAGELFSQIAQDEDVPQSLRGRARQMAGVLGVDAISDVDKVLEETGAETAAGAGPAAGSAQGN